MLSPPTRTLFLHPFPASTRPRGVLTYHMPVVVKRTFSLLAISHPNVEGLAPEPRAAILPLADKVLEGCTFLSQLQKCYSDGVDLWV